MTSNSGINQLKSDDPGSGESGSSDSECGQEGADAVRIAETFTSRQGEGLRTGNESFFIRTSGCNLRCWFCDTPYASWKPTGSSVTLQTLVSEANESNAGDVVLTGGEPLIWPQSQRLVEMLSHHGFHVTIETAGTIDRDVAPGLLSLSPKLRGSGPDSTKFPGWSSRHEQRRMPVDVMRRLIDRAVQTQVKFVISDLKQWDEIEACVESLGVPPDWVWIMPEATSVEQLDSAEAWARPQADESGFRYADRMQIRWYGNRPGT